MADDLYQGFEDSAAYGRWVGPPPLILGHRGTPRQAPENTLSGLRKALDLGLDGFEYDLRVCASGEAVLMHDVDLTRTTNSNLLLEHATLPELFGVDAGAWFGSRFIGEPVPLFDEALDVGAGGDQAAPLHMIELKELGLVPHVAEKLEEVYPRPPVRVASFLREVVLAANRIGLPTMLLADRASEDDRLFCRREKITAYGVGPGGWEGAGELKSWSNCERWSWSLDDPEHLLAACREPLHGFNTNEPYRALAVRALVRLAPEDDGPYPVQCPELIVEPESLLPEDRQRGEWYGAWSPTVQVRNPFPFPVEVRCSVFFPSGAFQSEGLPRVFDLEPGESRDVPFELKGGSRSPGPDPLFAALFRWRVSTGSRQLRPGGRLLLDAPLHRHRTAVADPLTRRLALLAESPGDPNASITLRRKGLSVGLTLEHPGDLEEAHLVAILDGILVRGGNRLRLALPAEFDRRPEGVTFTCGIEGLRDGVAHLRRWAGGLPEGLGQGAPGRLVPLG